MKESSSALSMAGLLLFMVYIGPPGQSNSRPLVPCYYVPGDINGDGVANGLDVVFAVAYYKDGPAPRYFCDCPPYGPFIVAGDVNGNCTFNGIDITYFVHYLKGERPALLYCLNCPPAT